MFFSFLTFFSKLDLFYSTIGSISPHNLSLLWLLWWLRVHLPMEETWIPPLVRSITWGREWLPTPLFLQEEFHGRRNRWSMRSPKESDMTERLNWLNWVAKIRGANPPAEILMNSLTHPENFDYQVEHAFLLKDNYGAVSVMSHALIDLEIPNNAHFFFF